jgi:adenylyl cyclase-associated protein
LNKGEAVTQGLKKVDKSEMTHKNPELRAGGLVGSTSGEFCFCFVDSGPARC